MRAGNGKQLYYKSWPKQQDTEAKNLTNQLPSTLRRSMELSQEKGACTWLTALPIDDSDEHGFALHKSAFRDALSLRYGWSLQSPPFHCTCSHPFSVEHALNCKTGGFPAIRHTVEPPNKGHFGNGQFVLFSEAVPIS